MPWNLIYRHLPGWRVHWALTGRGGLCRWHDRSIVLDPGMTRARERSVLAHEAYHAIRGPFPRWMSRREEEVVSRAAARYLIPWCRLLDAVAWSTHPAEVAEELDVDVPTLEARIRGLHPAERAALMRRMEHHHA